MSKLILRRQCSSRIHHQLVLSLHRATSPCIPENLSFKSANNPFAERWRTADRKCPLPILLRRFFPAVWYLFTKLDPQISLSPVPFLVLTPPLPPSPQSWSTPSAGKTPCTPLGYICLCAVCSCCCARKPCAAACSRNTA
jgi:hypothetical protein